MKRLFSIAAIVATLFLAASCQLEFIDEDNTLCRDVWQMESVSTISKEGVVVGFEDKTANASYVRFFFNGTWAFESESGDAPEYGFWSTDIVPANGKTFPVILISDNPGGFIQKGYSGEEYQFTLSEKGDTLSIKHIHTDEPDYRVMRLHRSSFPGLNTSEVLNNK